ncbi:NAD(P)/FAD-dependent oxidoreductase [Yanghanlia caeni]|uniref:FAD-binding oxidoreductase n=1 Tax=Yanghanlia caeni TaxID=3064283 RepID=A0ABU1DA34_9BURK|nr:FAD-binding oxidoreductase [Alcaligenaceae bacterium LG-2]
MTHIRSIGSHPAAASLWAATASDAPPVAPLTQSAHADVVIVGAGFTGLSTALHLAEAGVNTCVLDAHAPAWGASGRNGGQVNPTLKYDPNELRRMFGAKADALIQTVSTSADLVFSLIDRHHIDCDAVRAGWIQASYHDKGVPALHRRAEQWQRLNIPVSCLDRDEILKRTGSNMFAGGWLDHRAGKLHPLSYARGLLRAALSNGAQVHGNSPVTQLQRQDGKWVATVAAGATVKADQVVLATNGYTDALWPGLARTVLSANSFIAATRPLGTAADHILAKGETLSTAERLMIYLSKDRDGRLLMGGRGQFRDPKDRSDFLHLERSLELLYPQLAPFEIEYRWSGRIAITRDFLPHIHQPEPGLTMALGYNGRGIAMSTSMGQQLAKLLCDRSGRDDFPFPITPIQPIPMHGLQRFYIAAGLAWYSLLDRLSKR